MSRRYTSNCSGRGKLRQILTGWKSIANYFDVSVSTVKKWYYEFERPPPIRRSPSGGRIALVEELQCWVKENCDNGDKKLKRGDAGTFQGFGKGRSSSRKVTVLGPADSSPEERARWRGRGSSEMEREALAFEEQKEMRLYQEWAKEYHHNPTTGSFASWKANRRK